MANKKTVEEIIDEQAEIPEEILVETPEIHVIETAIPEDVRPEFQTIRAEAGDSYVSIAERLGGGRELAEIIAKKNRNAPIAKGTKLIVPVR